MTNQSHPNPTIKDRVLEILSDGKWHTQNEFLSKFLYTARNRIAELNEEWEEKDDGRVIISEKVEGSQIFRYRIEFRNLCHKIKCGGGYSWRYANQFC